MVVELLPLLVVVVPLVVVPVEVVVVSELSSPGRVVAGRVAVVVELGTDVAEHMGTEVRT